GRARGEPRRIGVAGTRMLGGILTPGRVVCPQRTSIEGVCLHLSPRDVLCPDRIAHLCSGHLRHPIKWTDQRHSACRSRIMENTVGRSEDHGAALESAVIGVQPVLYGELVLYGLAGTQRLVPRDGGDAIGAKHGHAECESSRRATGGILMGHRPLSSQKKDDRYQTSYDAAGSCAHVSPPCA